VTTTSVGVMVRGLDNDTRSVWDDHKVRSGWLHWEEIFKVGLDLRKGT